MDDYISKSISVHVLGAKLSTENWALVEQPVIKRFADVIGPCGIVQLIDTFVTGWPAMGDAVRGALSKKDALSSLEGASALLGQIDSVSQETAAELRRIRKGYSGATLEAPRQAAAH